MMNSDAQDQWEAEQAYWRELENDMAHDPFPWGAPFDPTELASDAI